MLTFFSIPKPFKGHIAIIQRNAITSWSLLSPKPEIILFGDEEGTSQVCQELGLRHIPDVPRNEFDTPLLNGIFSEVRRIARFHQLCYVNADIILMSDFVHALDKLRLWNPNCVMVGARRDVEITELLDYTDDTWEEALRTFAIKSGQNMIWSSDYFVFQRGFFGDIPPFAVGRVAYDNWFLWKARCKAALVDATPSVLAIHQNHDSPADWANRSNGPEAKANRSLAGRWAQSYTLADATHELSPSGVRRRVYGPYANRLKFLAGLLKGQTKASLKRMLARSHVKNSL